MQQCFWFCQILIVPLLWEPWELILRTEGGLLGSDSENQMLGVFEGELVEEQEGEVEAD